MNPFRQIASDTASLIRDLRKGLQHVSWKLAWRSRRRQLEKREREAEAENLRRGVRVETKMCRECRALIPSGASSCPECGASTAHISSGGLGRWAEQALPFEISVTGMIISACFILFIVAAVLSANAPARPGDTPGLLGAMMSLDNGVLARLGANVGRYSAGPQFWRLLTAVFLHGNLMHIGFNCWALYVIGPLIDHVMGSRRYFVLFLFTGVGGNVVSLAYHALRGLPFFQVGASGALFGLIGVAAVYGYRRRDYMGEMLKRQMVQWAIYGVMMGLFLRADNAAHIGGFLCGAAAAAVLPDPRKLAKPSVERLWGVLAFAGVLACVGAFALQAARVVLLV